MVADTTTARHRCATCGKDHICFGSGSSYMQWTCLRCGNVNYPTMDTRDAYRADSPLFGSMLCPAVKVIGKDDEDGRSDSEPEVA